MPSLTGNPSNPDSWGHSIIDRIYEPLRNYTAGLTGIRNLTYRPMFERLKPTPKIRFESPTSGKLRPMNRKRWRKVALDASPILPLMEPIQAEFMDENLTARDRARLDPGNWKVGFADEIDPKTKRRR